MQEPTFKRHETRTPNIPPDIQRAFVEDSKTGKELLQKELSVNLVEQTLLGKRIATMRELTRDLPASDLRHGELILAMQMDQVELDELRVRESMLIKRIAEFE